jgi:hypothetical protein
MVADMDWYLEQESHTFDDVEAAADAEVEDILKQDALLRQLDNATPQQSSTPEEI